MTIPKFQQISKVAEFDIEREFIYKKSLPEVTQIPEMFTKIMIFSLL